MVRDTLCAPAGQTVYEWVVVPPLSQPNGSDSLPLAG